MTEPTIEDLAQEEYPDYPSVKVSVCHVEEPVKVQELPSRTATLRSIPLTAPPTGTIDQILSKDLRRKSVTFLAATNPVVFSDDKASIVSGFGFTLPTGVLLRMTTTDAIYATATTGSAVLNIIVENWAD